MSNTKAARDFVGYEYKEVTVKSEQVSMYLDGYENFGWQADGQTPVANRQGKTAITLKRNRKIINKAELTRLQRNFEACLNDIGKLEKSKTSGAAVSATILGILGTAFMAGSTFAVTAQPPHIALCIILAIPGFVGWILPYFVYRTVSGRQSEKMGALIEDKYEEIYEICEKGSKLLY